MKEILRSGDGGFTLPEMLVTLALIGVIAATAVTVMPNLLAQMRADSSVASTLNTLRLARNRALAERRNVELVFIQPSQIQIVRDEIPGPATTVLSNVYLENNQRFLQFTGVPDTPDLFGANAPLAFGATPKIMFTSQGTFVDANGDVLNGTVFLGSPGDPNSARAVTIFGPTALLRTWRWNGRQWTE
jgi:prepilin-type N-terminal cleavage/methylation domain-containing protein